MMKNGSRLKKVSTLPDDVVVGGGDDSTCFNDFYQLELSSHPTLPPPKLQLFRQLSCFCGVLHLRDPTSESMFERGGWTSVV